MLISQKTFFVLSLSLLKEYKVGWRFRLQFVLPIRQRRIINGCQKKLQLFEPINYLRYGLILNWPSISYQLSFLWFDYTFQVTNIRTIIIPIYNVYYNSITKFDQFFRTFLIMIYDSDIVKQIRYCLECALFNVYNSATA